MRRVACASGCSGRHGMPFSSDLIAASSGIHPSAEERSGGRRVPCPLLDSVNGKGNGVMKVLSVLMIICIVHAGCSSSYYVSTSPDADPSYPEFNTYADGRSGVIILEDGSELEIRTIIASPDSTVFVKERNGAIGVVPTRTIRKVVFVNRLSGYLEGFGLGALAGAATILTMRLASPSGGGELSGWDYTLLFTVLGAGGGGVIGGIPGVTIGHRNEYRFANGADSLRVR